LKGGEHVLIKPNICNGKNPNGMVITDFSIIKSVINFLSGKAGKITIVESDNISGTADERLSEAGLLKKISEWEVDFLNLSEDNYEIYNVAGQELRLPESVLNADYLVNIPKIKTCAHTLVTLSIKNMFGVLQRSKKNKLHKHLDEILLFLTKTVPQNLIIVDGLTCMEGNGPVIGTPLSLGVIVAGFNPVSVDAVCSSIMGFNPLYIPHIVKPAELGLGEADINKIRIVGDDWTGFVCDFDKPYTISSSLKSIKSIRDIYLRF
jgi:uncharacterized protein (DUF362 family)